MMVLVAPVLGQLLCRSGRKGQNTLFLIVSVCKSFSSNPVRNAVSIFDRQTKKWQREYSGRLPDSSTYDYLKEEIGWRVADRVFDIKRNFDTVLDVGCGKGYVFKHFDKEMVGRVVACEMAAGLLDAAECPEGVEVVRRPEDEETVQLEENSVDLAVSSLSLHWVNDLPGCFGRVYRSLRPDCAFIGAMFGGDTLYQLRCSLQLASMERDGGVGVHVSPFVRPTDVGSLLNQAGFTLLTVDVDAVEVGFPSMFELLWDLQGMAENNAAVNRKLHLNRDTLMAAAAIYQEMYGADPTDAASNPGSAAGSGPGSDSSSSVTATFEVVYFIGWKPGPNQPRPLPRGSGNVSLHDLSSVVSGKPS